MLHTFALIFIILFCISLVGTVLSIRYIRVSKHITEKNISAVSYWSLCSMSFLSLSIMTILC